MLIFRPHILPLHGLLYTFLLGNMGCSPTRNPTALPDSVTATTTKPVHTHPVPASFQRPVRLLAVGDILLAGPMGDLMTRKGYNFPFARLRSQLRAADLTFGNLECSVSIRGVPLTKQFTFRARPAHVRALAENGFDVVSLANNHTWDFGYDALQDTVQHVRNAGVLPVGAGDTPKSAHRAVIVLRNGLKVGFLAYLGLHPALLPERPNAPSLAMANPVTLWREIKTLRKQVDFVLVSLHAGAENVATPTPKQRYLARTAIDAGADLVIGHHPHVIQPLVRYKNRWIAYSLGNFVFSTRGRGSGALLEATLHPGGKITARLRRLVLDGPQPHLVGM